MTTISKLEGGTRPEPRVKRVIKEGEKVRALLTVKQGASIEDILETRVIPFMGTTDAEDRDTDIVEPGGGDFAAFAKNPVFLWCHNNREPPLGNVTRIEAQDNGLLMPVKFNDPEDSEFRMSDGTLVLSDHAKFGEHVFRLYAHKIMNAVSIGFIPKVWEERDHWSFVFKEWEMLELSGCPVPANPEALQQRSRALDESVEAVEEWCGKFLDVTKAAKVQTDVITTIAGKAAEGDDPAVEPDVKEIDTPGPEELSGHDGIDVPPAPADDPDEDDDDIEPISTIADDKSAEPCEHCGRTDGTVELSAAPALDEEKLSTLIAIKVARAVENTIAKHQAPLGAPTTETGEESVIFITTE